MARYIALLRGISPMNAKMPQIKRCFESAGFTGVRTLLASGNVAFDARRASPTALQKKAEAAMETLLGHHFLTIVRPRDALAQLVAADPFAAFELPAGAKRVVTFLREPSDAPIAVPDERDGARVLKVGDSEIFTAYVPTGKSPAFMALIERTFGKALTTRTFETVVKCAVA